MGGGWWVVGGGWWVVGGGWWVVGGGRWVGTKLKQHKKVFTNNRRCQLCLKNGCHTRFCTQLA